MERPLGHFFNHHYKTDGEGLFRAAASLAARRVSKRLGSLIAQGNPRIGSRSKIPKAPAVTREAEEDWKR
jgi:hypothetical protein